MNEASQRGRRLRLNTISSLANQMITVVCGIILPRLILVTYGSEVNGLINSITQFLQMISFLELGVGAVVQASLYKPLAKRDTVFVSQIMASAQKFFSKLARILLIYVVILMIGYPFVAEQDFGWVYTALMIAVISFSSFAQYFFGITNSLLLRADQRGYIQYILQLATVILNTIACVVLIKLGAGIHVVKLTTSLIFVFRPIFLHRYVTKRYKINRRIKFQSEPIKQKWNGVAQHVAAVVLDGTDNIVLTVFSTLANVSIYSVYHLVIYGVKNLFLSLTNGMHSLIGELWAKQELDTLKDTFGRFEWILHTGTVFVFGCTGMLILPFISVYTSGITDVNYIQPLFAVLITVANAGHCLRLPYSLMILAGGHFKQTQSNYIIAAIINVVLSVVLVISFGLVGVAIGTLAAMMYQTVWMAYYVSKNLIKWPFKNFLKQIGIDTLSVVLSVAASYWITMSSANYLSWVVMAVKVALVWITVMVLINLIFYRRYVTEPALVIKEKIMKFTQKCGGVQTSNICEYLYANERRVYVCLG